MKEWIESILFFMILSSVITELVPEDSYKTGIRFFSGLILVILTALPVTEYLFSMEIPDMSGLFEFHATASEEEEAYFEEIFQNGFGEEGKCEAFFKMPSDYMPAEPLGEAGNTY